MDCSEFLSRFSEFYDAPNGAPERQEAEAHMAACGNCARYNEVVSRSVALLHAMPRAELGESFRARLQHRLYHLDDDVYAARSGRGSATPVVTVLGMAILLTVIAWSPVIDNGVPEVVLPPIVVSDPPMSDPVLEFDVGGLLPVSTGSPAPSGLLSGGLWSDAKNLLYKYSPMSKPSRSQSDGGERVLRRTGLD